eukprot:s3165_g4.t1
MRRHERHQRHENSALCSPDPSDLAECEGLSGIFDGAGSDEPFGRGPTNSLRKHKDKHRNRRRKNTNLARNLEIHKTSETCLQCTRAVKIFHTSSVNG